MNFSRCGWCLRLPFMSCVLQALKARSLLLICSSPQKKPPSYQYLSGIDNHFKSQTSTVKIESLLWNRWKNLLHFLSHRAVPLPVPSRTRNRLIEKDHITRMQTKVLVCLNGGVEIGNLCWISGWLFGKEWKKTTIKIAEWFNLQWFTRPEETSLYWTTWDPDLLTTWVCILPKMKKTLPTNVMMNSWKIGLAPCLISYTPKDPKSTNYIISSFKHHPAASPKKENTDACCSAKNDLWRLLWKHRVDLSDEWDE